MSESVLIRIPRSRIVNTNEKWVLADLGDPSQLLRMILIASGNPNRGVMEVSE